MQTYRVGLDQFEQGNAARGHAGEMEAVSHAIPPLPRALPRRQDPRRYVVRDANGQALAYIYSRGSEAEALQVKVLTKDEAQRIAVNLTRLLDIPPSPCVCPSSRQLNVAINLKFEIDPADRDNGLRGQRAVAFQLPLRVSVAHGHSISRCAVTPSFLRNLRTLVLRAYSSMVVLPTDSRNVRNETADQGQGQA